MWWSLIMQLSWISIFKNDSCLNWGCTRLSVLFASPSSCWMCHVGLVFTPRRCRMHLNSPFPPFIWNQDSPISISGLHISLPLFSCLHISRPAVGPSQLKTRESGFQSILFKMISHTKVMIRSFLATTDCVPSSILAADHGGQWIFYPTDTHKNVFNNFWTDVV